MATRGIRLTRSTLSRLSWGYARQSLVGGPRRTLRYSAGLSHGSTPPATASCRRARGHRRGRHLQRRPTSVISRRTRARGRDPLRRGSKTTLFDSSACLLTSAPAAADQQYSSSLELARRSDQPACRGHVSTGKWQAVRPVPRHGPAHQVVGGATGVKFREVV